MLTDDNILKRLNRSIKLVHFIQPRDLYKPPDVVGVQSMEDYPFRELVPFVGRAAVDAYTPFAILSPGAAQIV
jgi:hypothetical protein